jgi:hypothetical protein
MKHPAACSCNAQVTVYRNLLGVPLPEKMRSADHDAARLT